jgi:hypothetical protein
MDLETAKKSVHIGMKFLHTLFSDINSSLDLLILK